MVVLKIQSRSQDNNQNSGLTPDAGHFGRPIVKQMPQQTVCRKRKKKSLQKHRRSATDHK